MEHFAIRPTHSFGKFGISENYNEVKIAIEQSPPPPNKLNFDDSPNTCVFCRQSIATRTREHIIPRWLFKGSTSLLNLASTRARVFLSDNQPKLFSLDSLSVGACSQCNNRWALLEDLAKQAVTKLYRNTGIDEVDADVLLDWFDKLRFGIPLVGVRLSGNILNYLPNFSIDSRVRLFDRILVIYRVPCTKRILEIPFLDEPLLQAHPAVSCFRIGHLTFLTWSAPGIACNSFGLTKFEMDRLPLTESEHGPQAFRCYFGPPTSSVDHVDIPIFPKRGLLIAQSIIPMKIFGNGMSSVVSDPTIHQLTTKPRFLSGRKLLEFPADGLIVPPITFTNSSGELISAYRRIINIELDSLHSNDLRVRNTQKELASHYRVEMTANPNAPLRFASFVAR